jgi:hypothetical protein
MFETFILNLIKMASLSERAKRRTGATELFQLGSERIAWTFGAGAPGNERDLIYRDRLLAGRVAEAESSTASSL